MRQQAMPTHVAKSTVFVVGALSGLAASVPSAVRMQAFVLVAFVIADTLTGLWVARHKPKQADRISSHRLIEKLISKLIQYSLLMLVASGAALMASTWIILSAGLMALIGVETLSLLENMIVLQQCGGINPGPLRAFFNHAARYLAVSNPTTLPVDNPETIGMRHNSTDSTDTKGTENHV